MKPQISIDGKTITIGAISNITIREAEEIRFELKKVIGKIKEIHFKPKKGDTVWVESHRRYGVVVSAPRHFAEVQFSPNGGPSQRLSYDQIEKLNGDEDIL